MRALVPIAAARRTVDGSRSRDGRRIIADVHLFQPDRKRETRLLWSRDIRFVHRLAGDVPRSRILELDSGTVLIAPADRLTDAIVGDIADQSSNPDYGLAMLDPTLPERDRYLVALSAAVQASGLADRIGMGQSPQLVQSRMLDYFFSLRNLHTVAFQPIVYLATGDLREYECLFRPEMPMLPQSISAVVMAAIATGRSVELDTFIVRAVLERAGALEAARRATGQKPLHIAINMTPASLLDPRFEAESIAAMVREVGLGPGQITLECTEQQAVSDVVPLKRQVKALRHLGFGFAVDDAGAGYASFALIAALRPSIIKIDRDIVYGIAHDDAKQALVEAFVSFGRRIGATLLAEGIEKRVDLTTLRGLGVDLGQGFMLGRPEAEPMPPRSFEAPTLGTILLPARVPSGA
jgi:EAL domain-containing protein (putative c-di-GMP-specific phosphodiesterase class I)